MHNNVNMHSTFKKLSILGLSGSLALSYGCATDPNTGQQTVNKAALGAIAGAVVGAAVAKKKDRKKGVLLGAALGGGAGYYFDRQAKELKEKLKDTDVDVERTPDGISLNMPGNVSFPSNQYALLPSFHGALDSVASVLNQYQDSRIKVAGHTDSQGSDSYNVTLSEKRANSVMRYLINQGIAPSRISSFGYGESYPVATNDTADGRAENRRVELEILGTEKTGAGAAQQ